MKNISKIFFGNCSFVIGATQMEDIPNTNMNEVAFVGRSNVGKSSLLNSLVNRNKLARVSKTPGCTKQINFFNLSDKIHIVDLPGYGYAKISKQERKKWDYLIDAYIRGRSHLKRIFLLIDSRHELKEVDVNAMNFLDDCGASYQIVLTKIDKISASELSVKLDFFQNLIKVHGACFPEIICTSTKKKKGIDELRLQISMLIDA